jgi:hypothetical protein
VSARGALPPAAAAVVLLAASGWLAGAADRARDPAARAAGGTASLGAAGAAAISLLWLEADDLYAAGRWPEMLAAYEAAGRVEPRLAGAWRHRGWHLAYNLAGGAAREEDRDRWVLEGLRVLDDGVRRNPGDAGLRTWRAFVLLERSGRWPSVERLLARERGAAPLDEAIALLDAEARRDPGDGFATGLLLEGLARRARRAVAAAREGPRGGPGPVPAAAADMARAREALAAFRAVAPGPGAEVERELAPVFAAIEASAR